MHHKSNSPILSNKGLLEMAMKWGAKRCQYESSKAIIPLEDPFRAAIAIRRINLLKRNCGGRQLLAFRK